MERRKFLVGMGSLAAGGAAATGTGAVTNFTAERSVNVAQVTTDSDGIISINPGEGADDAVEMSDGNLSINLSGTDGEGINLDSVYTIGENLNQVDLDEDVHTAFVVQNNDNIAHTLRADYTLDDRSWVAEDDIAWNNTNPSTTISIRPFEKSGGVWSSVNTEAQTVPGYHEGNLAEVDTGGFGPGEEVAFQIVVDATREDSSVGDDLSGTLEISATTPDQ